MPNPNKGESKEDYIKRFMSSPEAKKSFPDEKQRYAVALSKWKEHNKENFDLDEAEKRFGYEPPEAGDAPQAVKDILARVYATARKQYSDKGKCAAIAWGAVKNAGWKKDANGKWHKETLKDWRVLEFYVPIDERLIDGDDFIIRGVAINETTTLNNVKYVADELQKAAMSFRNVPILLDHKNEVKNIVGRTTNKVDFNQTHKRIDFEAKIMDKEIKQMIEDGRIQSVSIGAKVEDLIAEEDGSQRATGIKGLEISLVAVPGDIQANLAQALEHSVYLKEMSMKKDDVEFEEELNQKEDEMTEEVVEKTQEQTKVVSESSEKAPSINIKLDNSEMAEMRKQISELKELLVEKKLKMETIKEKEDKTIGEVSEIKEDIKELDNLILEKAKDGFSIYRDYSKEGSDTKLKRLVR